MKFASMKATCGLLALALLAGQALAQGQGAAVSNPKESASVAVPKQDDGKFLKKHEINLARAEMSRDPVVWWSFAAAFGFMVSLVLAANLFADGVRDAFDPKARSARSRVFQRRKAAEHA